MNTELKWRGTNIEAKQMNYSNLKFQFQKGKSSCEEKVSISWYALNIVTRDVLVSTLARMWMVLIMYLR